MTMRSKTSKPLDSNETRRALPSKSAALGGSGPDAMKAKLGISVLCRASGGVHAPVR